MSDQANEPGVDRREVLGAAAAGALLAGPGAAATAQVEDRSAPIRIRGPLGTGGPHPFSGNPDDVNRLVKMVQDTRQRLGPTGTIMFDAHCAIPPPMLLQFAAAIQPYDVLWIEEPAVPGNIEVFKRLKQQIPIPFATGERDRTIWEFMPYLHERAIDILQPDVAHCGGMTQMRKIAILADTFHTSL